MTEPLSRVGRWALTGICSYELGGLAGAWPTFSEIVWRHRGKHPFLTAIPTLVFAVWVTWHLLIEGRSR